MDFHLQAAARLNKGIVRYRPICARNNGRERELICGGRLELCGRSEERRKPMHGDGSGMNDGAALIDQINVGREGRAHEERRVYARAFAAARLTTIRAIVLTVAAGSGGVIFGRMLCLRVRYTCRVIGARLPDLSRLGERFRGHVQLMRRGLSGFADEKPAENEEHYG